MKFILLHIDWLGVCLSLLGWFLMAKKRFYALIVLCFANLVWLSWAIMTSVASLGFLQVCFMILNLRTIYEWIKTEKSKPVDFQDKSFLLLKNWLRLK
ncbi:MAG: hypothetical protein QM763_12775 [Agriterribacter sp.]